MVGPSNNEAVSVTRVPIFRRYLSGRVSRILLVCLVLTIALVISLGVLLARKIARDNAIAAIRAVGGRVVYSRWKDEPLEVHVGFGTDSKITDEQLAILSPFLQTLHDMGELDSLCINSPLVGDRGIKHLERLTALRDLNLAATGITDAGLVSLDNMRTLKVLSLEETSISDSGLLRLHQHRQLVGLFLRRTRITASGLRELKKALPSTMIAPQISPRGELWEGPPSS